MRRVASVIVLGTVAATDPLPGLTEALGKIAKNVSGVYNCSVSVAFKNKDGEAQAAYGTSDFATGQSAKTSDHYAFGSLTKMLTGASVLKLVSEGKLNLDDHIASIVDPYLTHLAAKDKHMTFASMGDLWGADNVANTTIRQLLSMTAGVPDFDTANPCYPQPCVPGDSLRAALYANPSSSPSPTDLMSVDWVKGSDKWKPCTSRRRKTPFCYSSTNFMLLGLALADNAGAASWDTYNQASFLPEHLKDSFVYATHGTPKDNGVIHGYDRTHYNAPSADVVNDHDNHKVAGVFSGWSASDITGSVSAAADLTWSIYRSYEVAPKEVADLMIPEPGAIYGLASHNLGYGGMGFNGQNNKYGVGYGHLGATYGYQSVTAYFPELDFVVSVGTNIETDNQAQPALAMCYTFNKAASLLLKQDIQCHQTSGSYFGGGCECTQISNETVV